MGAGGGALLLAVANLISYLAGLWRDLTLAGTFGAGAETDAFFAGFLIPDFLFNFLVLGFVSGALLPVFLSAEKISVKKAESIFRSFLTIVTLASTILSAGAFFLAPWLIGALFGTDQSGLPRNEAELQLILHITRILLLSPILFGISNSIGMILLAKRHFFSMAISPFLYNFGIIIGIIFFGEQYGILAAAWGAVGGAVGHLLSRAIDFPATKIRLVPKLEFTPELLTVLRLGIPKTLGLVAFQLVIVVFAVLAAKTETGGLAAWNYARNIQSFPVSLFGIAIGTAALPFLTSFAVENNWEKFRSRLQKSAIQILFFTIPAAVGLMYLATETIRVLFERGEFNEHAIFLTSSVLFWVALSIPFESLTHLVSRAFLARKNTFVSAAGKAIFFLVAAGFSSLFVTRIGVAALGIAFSLAAFSEIVFLVVVFCWKYFSIATSSLLPSLGKIIALTCILAVSLEVFLLWSNQLNKFGRLGGAIALGTALYFLGAMLLKITEIQEVFVFRRHDKTSAASEPDANGTLHE